MKDEAKSKKQLLGELVELRQRVAEMKKAEVKQSRADEALRQSEARLLAAIESVPFDFFVIDENGRYVMQNTTCRERWGDLIGKRPGDLGVDEDTLALWESNNSRAFAGEVVQEEVHFVVEGEEGFYHNIISPIRDGGQIRGILGVNIDITQCKRAEGALRQAHDELEQRVQERTRELREANKQLEGEIHERKLAEGELKESEGRFRMLVETMRDALGVQDENGIITYVNQRACEMTGYSKEELIGHPPTDFIEEPYRSVYAEEFAKRRDGVSSTYELTWTGKDGRRILTSSSSAPIFDLEGNFKGSFAVFTDITKRKIAEEALRASEARHRLLLEASPDPIVVYDMEGRATYVSPAFESAFGWSSEELLGKLINFVPEESWPETKAAIDKVLQGEKIRFLETRRLTKDGKVLHIQLSSSLYHDQDGKPAGSIVILRDISKRRLTEKALKESEENYRNLVENALVGIYASNLEGKTLYVNEALANMMGFDYPQEMISQGALARYKNPKDREILIDKLVKKGRVDNFEFEALTKKNNVRVLLTSATLDRDTISGVIVNITERKRVEEALRKREYDLEIQSRHLEEANAALRVLLRQREADKAELEEKVLSNVKELVAPYVERLKRSGLDANQSVCIDILESNLNDIVSPFVYKLSSAYLGLTPTEIHVANLVKEAKDTKTIAELLHLSPRTVESHRQNIRKKLGLQNKRANLRTHLLSLQ